MEINYPAEIYIHLLDLSAGTAAKNATLGPCLYTLQLQIESLV